MEGRLGWQRQLRQACTLSNVHRRDEALAQPSLLHARHALPGASGTKAGSGGRVSRRRCAPIGGTRPSSPVAPAAAATISKPQVSFMPSSAAAQSGLVGRGMGNPLGAAKRCWATMAYRQRLNFMVPVTQSCSREEEHAVTNPSEFAAVRPFHDRGGSCLRDGE